MTYELHPLCTLFPRLSGSEFNALRDDIKTNGLRQMIVLYNGMILDGGNRYRACLEAGVKPRFVDFGDGNLVSFVLSQNMHRRHMTPGQQAAIVASAQDWAKAQGNGGDRRSDQSATLHSDRASDRAAESGASLRTQKMADKVAKADPDLAVKVGHGEISLPAAVARVEAKEPKKKAKPAKTSTATPGDTHDESPGPVQATKSAEPADIEVTRADLAEKTARADELLEQFEQLFDENVEYGKILDADDKLAEAHKAIARLTAEVRVLKTRVHGLMGEKNEAISAAKSWRRKHDALEKKLKAQLA